MIKKNTIGDYVATCDKCKYVDDCLFYDFRRAQVYYEALGWSLLDDGSTYCPHCKHEISKESNED